MGWEVGVLCVAFSAAQPSFTRVPHCTSAYKGSQLLEDIPSPPVRVMKIFRHTTPDFVEGRRAKLQEFITKLLRVPRAVQNNDVLGLLGLFEKTRETSVLFREGPMGLTIHEVGGHVVVADFKNRDDGSKGQAEAAGKIGIGDRYVDSHACVHGASGC